MDGQPGCQRKQPAGFAGLCLHALSGPDGKEHCCMTGWDQMRCSLCACSSFVSDPVHCAGWECVPGFYPLSPPLLWLQLTGWQEHCCSPLGSVHTCPGHMVGLQPTLLLALVGQDHLGPGPDFTFPPVTFLHLSELAKAHSAHKPSHNLEMTTKAIVFLCPQEHAWRLQG